MRLRADQKLFLTYLTIIALVVLALTVGVGQLLRRHLTDMLARDLNRELALANSLYDTRRAAAPDSIADWLSSISGRRVTLIDLDGTVRGDSDLRPDQFPALENHRGRPEIAAALTGGVGRDVRMSHSIGIEHLYMAVRTRDARVIRLAVPLHEVKATVARVQRGIFGVGFVALVLTGLLSLAFSIAVTHPLRQIAGVARAMAAGDLTRRARSDQGDELGELADALDTLAAELQRRLGQLEGERAEMQALIDGMSEGVIAVDGRGHVQRANPAARRLFSLPADPRGLSPHEVARRQAFQELVRAALDGAPVLPTELTQDGRNLLATAQPLPTGGAVMVFLDVSELRRLEDVRRDFVANASHELKTPLTAIRGFAETLLDPGLPPALRDQFTRTVKDNADRLQRIIDDLLDLSRIETGGWRVQPEIISITEIADEAWSALDEAACQRGVTITGQVAVECEFVYADPSALRQVFTNLFGNALRYSPRGGTIELLARGVAGRTPGTESRAEGAGWIEIAVRDRGTGIASTHLPRIFERFYRADTARSREDGGTGLGLAIVKHLVEGHGGSVDAESELGRGTTIRFTLPAPEEMDAASADADAFAPEADS
ncbi:sensor histidine kinase [Longimicrobium terrae]|uniref:histidine kinase n=1 Tax=Longimicrobium terrae TaxID=1639882 RepID=A0A841H6K7_9BACT|nr:HAMP domain-containing sensor histidine kinase [Longimicrobium terrae]MBB4639420.1 two-component system phosphate regulon sensor histidine kinase PhoR [Longimicrobium terrae]MBB6073727.1 two-component system phosphate regulon sensor histidine kinase PhoR [Longimicrobium terrae]NNC30669.1 HAMP domain-containing protein [Longimicrobium terrae]